MLKKDVIEDDYSYISDSQLEQMEKLKPLISVFCINLLNTKMLQTP